VIRLWHAIFSGHRWEVKAQTYCRPDTNLANWMVTATNNGDYDKRNSLVAKYRYGFSEALLVCSCGKYVKIEMIGTAK